ncbi:MAG TPA: hypothetical protein VM938_01470 [Acidimicrobiales bacterium]|nr:hypothetical protein [Acidimicrobiales bacterium]
MVFSTFGVCAQQVTESMSGVLTGNCWNATGMGVTYRGHTFRLLWEGNTWVMAVGTNGATVPTPTLHTPLTDNSALVGTGDIMNDVTHSGSCFSNTATRFLLTGSWAAPLHPSPAPAPPPPNYPPGVPTLVSPPAGHAFAPTDTQQFVIQATDPESDRYTGRIRVTDTATNLVVGTYFTPQAASGAEATAPAVPPLPPGSYTWVADATDDVSPTGYGPASAPRTLTVTSPVPPLPPPPVPYPSETCAGGTVHEDGFVGSAYTRLHSVQPSPGTTAVCFRSEVGGLGIGGKVTFASGNTAAPAVPSTDTSASLCATTSGNAIPPPHPVFSGSLGDPADPTTYVPFSADLFASASEGWLCLTAGSVSRRVVVPVPHTGTPPSVTFATDGTTSRLPSSTVNTSPTSGACQGATTGSKAEYANLTGAFGRTWLHTWQESATRAHVCIRTQGSATTGGRLTIDTTGSGGVSPVFSTSATDTSACTLRVAGVDTPTTAEVRRSASLTDTSGVSFCVVAGSTRVRVTLGAAGSPTPPQATWTADT